MQHKLIIFFIVLLGMLALSACGSSVPEPVSVDSLAGSAWTLSALKGQPTLPGTSISAEFSSDNRISGSAGCNSYAGRYAISGNSITIDASSIASTMMACAQPVMDQESVYLKMLADAKTFSVRGDEMTLADASNNTIATFSAVNQDLVGTDWEVLNYNNGMQAVVSLVLGTKITARFGQDGNISGNSGCNEYSGPFKVDGKRISIGSLVSTNRECIAPEGVMQQEAQYLAALRSAATYRIDGAALELRTSDDALAVYLMKK